MMTEWPTTAQWVVAGVWWVDCSGLRWGLTDFNIAMWDIWSCSDGQLVLLGGELLYHGSELIYAAPQRRRLSSSRSN